MMKYAELVILYGLLAAFSASLATPGRAANECFCMTHASSGAILRGCISYNRPNDANHAAVCTDPITGKTSPPQTMSSEWAIIKEGTGICAPCQLVRSRSGKTIPRSGDDPLEKSQ